MRIGVANAAGGDAEQNVGGAELWNGKLGFLKWLAELHEADRFHRINARSRLNVRFKRRSFMLVLMLVIVLRFQHPGPDVIGPLRRTFVRGTFPSPSRARRPGLRFGARRDWREMAR